MTGQVMMRPTRSRVKLFRWIQSSIFTNLDLQTRRIIRASFQSKCEFKQALVVPMESIPHFLRSIEGKD